MNERPDEPSFSAASEGPAVLPPDEPLLPGSRGERIHRRHRPKPDAKASHAPAFLLSWRFALLIALALMIVMPPLKHIFGPLSEERIAVLRQRIAEGRAVATSASNGSGGELSAIPPSGPAISGFFESLFGESGPRAFANRKVVAGLPLVDLRLTLAELLEGFDTTMTATYETVETNRFIVRLTGVNPLTREHEEFALQFFAVDGPEEVAPLAAFKGEAVIFNGMAFNAEQLTDDEAVEALLMLRGAALLSKQ